MSSSTWSGTSCRSEAGADLRVAPVDTVLGVRQLFTWRFVAAVAALAGLVFLLDAIIVDEVGAQWAQGW